ncbi:MAG: hypothetical protein SCJ97_11570, partial [Bacillota bacterium]|nr:hypothetical protein [Bacillota bacterium]
MHTDFTAAYGPFACFTEEIEPNGGPEWWWNEPDDDQWGFEGGFPADDVVLGEDYVGNYFTMDAWFRTSMGTTKRFVSLSSPFSHAYLTEDITVVGRAEVKEALELMNLPEGTEATTDWWDLF